MKTKLFLLLLVLCVLSAQAQNLSVKGRVTDASQEAIIAANVSLWATDSTLVTGVTSDAQGKFTLNKIKAGNYRLAITFIGYQSEVILLKLNNNLDLGDVQLQEDAVSLGEVTVSASNVLPTGGSSDYPAHRKPVETLVRCLRPAEQPRHRPPASGQVHQQHEHQRWRSRADPHQRHQGDGQGNSRHQSQRRATRGVH